ncbi:MAG: hypothetical protein U1E10_03105 [Bdellovibrionales bacterium]|nr:hypothetical protein [Bdellovibrionales bacterium]
MWRRKNDIRFCAFCGHQHRIYAKSHVSFFDIAISIFLGFMVFAPIAGGIDARGLGVAAVFVGISEVFTVIRHRMSLSCGRCGFDPIVYRRSHDEAAKLVKAHLARRAEDPMTLLATPVRAVGIRKAKPRDRRESSHP